jgi:hypothetical protein
MSILKNTLQTNNAHIRDKNIQFYEPTHTYTIIPDAKSKYKSVTTWNHSHFPHFDADDIIKKMMSSKGWKEGHKYWGLTAAQIKAMWTANGASVSGAGTNMHFEIECFMNNPDGKNPNYTHTDLLTNYLSNSPDVSSSTLEWQYFINYVKDTPLLKPYRTEWTIYHEDLKLAGSIDMVYENPDGTLSIYDWKRAKDITRVNNFGKYAITDCISHMPDSNFWHYALQLNTYKAILEEKYDKKITDLYLVRLHPDAEEKNYELIKLPDLTAEIRELFAERRKEINNEIVK